jgi:hypothetical protein
VSVSSVWARRAVPRNEGHAWCLHPPPGSGVASGARLVFVKPAFGRLSFLIRDMFGAGVPSGSRLVFSGARLVFVKPAFGRLSFLIQSLFDVCVFCLGSA